MAEYNVGDRVVLKDDGQVYTVVGVRTENRVVLFDLEKGNERASTKLTVLRSQIEIQKTHTPKYPQTVVYKANRRNPVPLAVTFLLLLVCHFAMADEIVLKSGEKIEGKITEVTDKYVKIDPGIGMSVTYYRDQISTFVQIKPGAEKRMADSLAPFFKEMAESVSKDVNAGKQSSANVKVPVNTYKSGDDQQDAFVQALFVDLVRDKQAFFALYAPPISAQKLRDNEGAYIMLRGALLQGYQVASITPITTDAGKYKSISTQPFNLNLEMKLKDVRDKGYNEQASSTLSLPIGKVKGQWRILNVE